MRPRSRPPLTITVSAIVMLVAIAALAFLADRRSFAPPSPRPPARLSVEPTGLRVVPDDVTAARKRRATRDISETLRELYTRAFVARHNDARPSPTPTVTARVRGLVTKPALVALKKTPGVFDRGDIVVFDGTVSYTGLITFDVREPLEALLEVDFRGRGTPPGRAEPTALVHQRGTLVMKQTADGWLVDGFDLRFDMKPAPTPTETP